MKFIHKRRLVYAGMLVLMVLLGLASRKAAASLPLFIASHAGDALWAAMVYFGLRIFFISKSSRYAALLSLIFCFAIEASQLYQADWINAIRQSTLGALVLGRGFLAIDLLRYFTGILLAYLCDVYLLRPNLRPTILPLPHNKN